MIRKFNVSWHFFHNSYETQYKLYWAVHRSLDHRSLTKHELRARKALMQFEDVMLRFRMVLLLYEISFRFRFISTIHFFFLLHKNTSNKTCTLDNVKHTRNLTWGKTLYGSEFWTMYNWPFSDLEHFYYTWFVPSYSETISFGVVVKSTNRAFRKHILYIPLLIFVHHTGLQMQKNDKKWCFYTFSFFWNRPVNFQATLLILSNYSVNLVCLGPVSLTNWRS